MECVALKKGAWLKEETDYLEANWAEMTDKAIGKVLNRRTGAVLQKRHSLGLTVSKAFTTLYMACTPDKYELPMVVTDSLKEMEQLTGYSEASIRSSTSRPATITERSYGYIFRKVRIKKTKGE